LNNRKFRRLKNRTNRFAESGKKVYNRFAVASGRVFVRPREYKLRSAKAETDKERQVAEI